MTEQQAERLVQAVEALVTLLAARELPVEQPAHRVPARLDRVPQKGQRKHAA